MTDEKKNELVPRPSAEVQRIGSGPSRLLSRVVGDALVLARAIVPQEKRFRLGNYEFREPDYRQIHIWADCLGLAAEEVLLRLEQSTYEKLDGQLVRFLVVDGAIRTLVFNETSLVSPNSVNLSPVLDLSHVPELTKLYCGNNWNKDVPIMVTGKLDEPLPLGELDISRVPGLTELHCQGCYLTKLDLSHVPGLIELNCSDNQLTELDLSNVPELEKLWCVDPFDDFGRTQFYGPLIPMFGQELSESGLSEESKFWASVQPAERFTPIVNKDLDLSQMAGLTVLWCGGNELTELNLSKMPRLTELWCGISELTELDLSHVPKLARLDCGENHLTELDLSHVSELKELYCHENQLTELHLSKVPGLTKLYCWNNQLTGLDLSKVPGLTGLHCGKNQLTGLDLSKVQGLESLYCDSNQLTELDLSHVPGLTRLDCRNNQLTELDVSANTALESVWCDQGVLVKTGPDQVVRIRYA